MPVSAKVRRSEQVVDWVVIGSGFGGSVAALRLAEKGFSVRLLEQGRRFADSDLPRSGWDLRRFLWMPQLGLRGILRREAIGDVTVLCGVGVGGGSLVYANTLFRPTSERFYNHPQWASLASWRDLLAPHFDTAERMLGVTEFKGEGPSERLMAGIAEELGVAETLRPTLVGVNFGDGGGAGSDPYFGGEGPPRDPCIRCGECMLGCRHNAKNTLVKNYLWFAERAGARIEPDVKVVDLRPDGAVDGSEGWVITTERPGAKLLRRRRVLRARGVVIAAGALGTNELLLQMRERGALPRLSPRVGEVVRTNSEAITAATSRRKGADYRADIAITASVYADDDTHFTNNTFGTVGDALATTYGPLTSGEGGLGSRRLGFVRALLRHPLRWLSHFTAPFGWSKRTVIFTVMQDLDNSIALKLGRRSRLRSVVGGGARPSAWLPVANEIAEIAARRMDGYAQSSVSESLQGSPTSAHFLGGAVIGESPESGVVDRHRRVFGYENLMICDGSTVPANVGVNPSLTTTALAEEAMSHVPENDQPTAAASADVRLNSLHTTLRKQFSELPVPESTERLVGAHTAHYVGPAPVRLAAPLFMGLLRFRGWRGKAFEQAPDGLTGLNRFERGGVEERRLEMHASLAPSKIDGRPALVVEYPPETIFPWRRARDEFRPLDDRRLLGITVFDVPGGRLMPLAFVLERD